MTRKSTIDRLSPSQVGEVMNTLQINPGWTIDEHVTWLSQCGVEISRSALHRFIRKLKIQAEETQPLSIAQDVRLRCLEVASSIYQGSEATELQSLASTLETWVYQQS